MAELGAIAAIIQVADTGLRLSTTLFTFAETVAHADKSINTISKDVSLTSAVLKELANILTQDKSTRAYSDTAIESAIAVVNECSGLFQELHSMLVEKLPKHSSGPRVKVSRTTLALERLKWPYLQSKMNILQSNLDRLKSSLLVILNVISLAKMMKTEPSSADIGQTDLVKDLIKSNQQHDQKYEQLKASISNLAIMDRQEKSLFADLEKALAETTPTEQETNLNNLHHFTLLFKTLVNETRSTSYDIGSQSRVRIEKHISSARASEVMWLYKVHGEATVRDVWGQLGPQAVTVLDSAVHEKYPQQTRDAVRPASPKEQNPRSQKSSVEQALGDHEVRDLTPEEWKSRINPVSSADEEHDPKALRLPPPKRARRTQAARKSRAEKPEVASSSPDVVPVMSSSDTDQLDAVNIFPTPERKRTGISCIPCRERSVICGQESPSCGNCFISNRACKKSYPMPLQSNNSDIPMHFDSFPPTRSEKSSELRQQQQQQCVRPPQAQQKPTVYLKRKCAMSRTSEAASSNSNTDPITLPLPSENNKRKRNDEDDNTETIPDASQIPLFTSPPKESRDSAFGALESLEFDGSKSLESKDYDTGDSKLDELLRLWTPTFLPV